jgi:hypothetical protein
MGGWAGSFAAVAPPPVRDDDWRGHDQYDQQEHPLGDQLIVSTHLSPLKKYNATPSITPYNATVIATRTKWRASMAL